MKANQLYFGAPRFMRWMAFILLLLAMKYLISFSTEGNNQLEDWSDDLKQGASSNVAIATENEPKQSERSSQAKEELKGLPLQEFKFDVVRVDSTGKIVNRRKAEARFYVEVLGGGITLEMVEIPSGTFLMGTSYAEAEAIASEYKRGLNESTSHYGDEYLAQQIPQHKVSVPSFYMGKFEVTQAQWRAVAQLPKVSKDLSPDPSYFKGDNLPVEGVTWEDAVEFCERLSRATGKVYRLPSEAEWEYACRAGTTTQFHFGNTITSELVNCNGNPFRAVPKGIDRERTIPVGSLGVANAFGLYDMHGNVEEWCMDSWHENYSEAPTDGRVWVTPGGSIWKGFGNDYRVVRGGSWLLSPSSSRSANRGNRWYTENKTFYTGFRVVAVARSQ